MVQIHQTSVVIEIVNGQKLVRPVTHTHKLNCKKSAPTFEEGKSYSCYITKNDGGRFAVFTSSGLGQSSYHVFDSAEELHDTFDEVSA